MDMFIDWPMLILYDKGVCSPEILVKNYLHVSNFKFLDDNEVRVFKYDEDMIIQFPRTSRRIQFMPINDFSRRGERTNLLLIPEHWRDRIKDQPNIPAMMYSKFIAYYDQKQFVKGEN